MHDVCFQATTLVATTLCMRRCVAPLHAVVDPSSVSAASCNADGKRKSDRSGMTRGKERPAAAAEPSRAERSPAEPSRASETYVNWFKSIVVELNNSKTVAAADDWLTDRSAWWQDEHRHHAGPAFSPSPPTFDLHCAAHKFPPAYACLYSRRSEYYAANATPIDGDRDSIQVL